MTTILPVPLWSFGLLCLGTCLGIGSLVIFLIISRLTDDECSQHRNSDQKVWGIPQAEAKRRLDQAERCDCHGGACAECREKEDRPPPTPCTCTARSLPGECAVHPLGWSQTPGAADEQREQIRTMIRNREESVHDHG